MTDYIVPLTGGVNFAPKDEVSEILQNVRTIINTRIGTVPLDRDFGVSWDHVDKPIAVARAAMIEEVIEAVHEYEPRATIRSVNFEETEEDAMEGVTRPRVVVSIGGSEEDAL